MNKTYIYIAKLFAFINPLFLNHLNINNNPVFHNEVLNYIK